MSRRKRSFPLVVAALLASSALAQDLRARVLAAAQLPGSEAEAALQALGLQDTPVQELLALFVDDSSLLAAGTWRRVAPHIHARTSELRQLWLQQPKIRRSGAQLFSRLDVDWVTLHAAGDADVRADIEALAIGLPFRLERARQLLSAHSALRSSALTLRRLAHEAVWQPVVDGSPDPFGLAAGMTSQDPVVRAETAFCARLLLGTGAPPWVHSAICMHPDRALRGLVWRPRPNDAQLEQYVTEVAAGAATQLVEIADLCDLSVAARRSAARRLLELGRTTSRSAPASPTSRYSRAGELFCDAVRLDPDVWPQLVTMLVESGDEHVREGVVECLCGLDRASLPADLPVSLLRRFEDLPESWRTDVASWLDEAIGVAEDEVVRGLLLSLARRSLTGDHRPRMFPRFHGCGNVPPPGPDLDRGMLLITAAERGLIELLDPTLERLAASELTDDELHLSLLWQVLVTLGPHADGDQAARLLAAIEDSAGGTTAARSQRASRRTELAIAIYGVVPEALLSRVDALLPESMRFEAAPPPMPATRYRRLLDRAADRELPMHLLAQCPELLTEHWNTAAEIHRRQLMREVGRLGGTIAIDLLMRAEELPFSLVEAVCESLGRRDEVPRLPLDRIVSLHAQGLRGPLAEMLESCVVSPSDGPALQSFVQRLEPRAKLVGVLCLHALGDDWHDAVRAALDELLADDDEGIVKAALQVAGDLDLRDCEWRAAADRVDPLTGDVARMRLGHVDVLQCRSDPIRLLSIVKTATPRETLAKIDGDLWPLLSDQPEETVVAALSLMADQPEWPQEAHLATACATLDTRAAVRRAAYAALATRDRSRWPSAWLAYEAALDPDPSVREVAPK